MLVRIVREEYSMECIPKIIHYCWFGKKAYNDLTIKCIESWKKYLPDYELIEWNEDNFDIDTNRYVREAYDSKKFAFVTDYVRLFVLNKFGGIYMDTDIEILKNFDGLLDHSAFTGFEDKDTLQTAIMGSKKENEWVKSLLEYYETRNFINKDGFFDLTTNVSIITNITYHKYNITLNNKLQEIEGILTIYPKDYFCPKNFYTEKISLTKNTFTIHHFNGSWIDNNDVRARKIDYKIKKLFGNKLGEIFILIIRIYKEEGFKALSNKIIKRAKIR
ncbi:MAG: glycosyltransferase [Bacillus sp. (in: firmicutes)]